MIALSSQEHVLYATGRSKRLVAVWLIVAALAFVIGFIALILSGFEMGGFGFRPADAFKRILGWILAVSSIGSVMAFIAAGKSLWHFDTYILTSKRIVLSCYWRSDTILSESQMDQARSVTVKRSFGSGLFGIGCLTITFPNERIFRIDHVSSPDSFADAIRAQILSFRLSYIEDAVDGLYQGSDRLIHLTHSRATRSEGDPLA